MSYRLYDHLEFDLSHYQNQIRRGTIVRFSFPFRGSRFEQENSRKLLDINKDYVIEDIYIDSREVSIWLQDFPSRYFNGLQFTLSCGGKMVSKKSFEYIKFYFLKKRDKVFECCKKKKDE